MNIGMITCNYFMRIYGYQPPEKLDWGVMVDKYRAEFKKVDFLKLAMEIKEMGYDHLEIWEPTFSHFVYTEEEAASLADALKALGFQSLAYCIGGWGAGDVPHIDRAYRFARALGAKVVTGCLRASGKDAVLPEIERYGLQYGLLFAIENHPAPNLASHEEIAQAIGTYQTVGANLDTGIYNMMGFDVLAAARLLRDKIYHVHFKDTKKGGSECLPIGDGDAPMVELIKLLKQWDYKSMVSVEFEYMGDPAPGLVKSLDFIRKNLA